MVGFFVSIGVLLSCSSAFANGTVNLKDLTEYAREHSYRDNQATILKDKIYSASTGFPAGSADAYAVIEGYPGGGGFTQVALWCDQCGSNEVTAAQTRLCQTEFQQLFKKLAGKAPPDDFVAKIKTPASKRVSLEVSNFRLRLDSVGALKCDGRGGARVRIDLFPN